MELSNAAIADALEELGDLYELDGAIVHRVLAYRTAAKTVRDATVSVAALARAGRASELPGIGETLQEKIRGAGETGTIPAAEKLRAKFPPGLVAITRLPGLGAKRARLLHSELGIDSPQALREAALAQRVRDRDAAWGRSSRRACWRRSTEPPRTRRGRSAHAAAAAAGARARRGLGAGLAGRDGGEDATVQVAGSARRMADSVKDIDLIAVTKRPVALARALAKLEEIESVVLGERGRGEGSHALGRERRSADRQAAGSWATCCSTSRARAAHNAALREAAVRRGLHVSEYGVLDDADGRTRTCASERGGVRGGSAWPTSSRSCARIAASSRRRWTAARVCRG